MLSDEKIEQYVEKWKETRKVRMYAPIRYFRGMKRMKDVFARLKTMQRRIEQAKKGVSVGKLLRRFN